jgi:hypothetical protein
MVHSSVGAMPTQDCLGNGRNKRITIVGRVLGTALTALLAHKRKAAIRTGQTGEEAEPPRCNCAPCDADSAAPRSILHLLGLLVTFLISVRPRLTGRVGVQLGRCANIGLASCYSCCVLGQGFKVAAVPLARSAKPARGAIGPRPEAREPPDGSAGS